MEIFVGNLPFDITEQEIKDAFAQYGEIASVKMLTDKMTGRFRGIAFVALVEDEKAQAAIVELNGKELKGRPMRIDKTRERENRFNGFGGGFKPRQGGFRPRQEGFNPRFGAPRPPREGGDQQQSYGDKPRFGGGFKKPFRPREDGGFRRREDGGFRPRPEGGFRNKEDNGGESFE